MLYKVVLRDLARIHSSFLAKQQWLLPQNRITPSLDPVDLSREDDTVPAAIVGSSCYKMLRKNFLILWSKEKW